MKRFVMYWALAGGIVPVVILLSHALRVNIHPYIILFVWPSSFMAMAIQEQGIAFAIVVIAISVMINMVIYLAVGAMIGSLLKR